MQALQDIGVEPQDICMLLRTLSGILWLGNLKIQPVHANAVDSSKIVADGALSNAAELLGLPQKELAHAITHKQVGWGGAVGRALQIASGGAHSPSLWGSSRRPGSSVYFTAAMRMASFQKTSLQISHRPCMQPLCCMLLFVCWRDRFYHAQPHLLACM